MTAATEPRPDLSVFVEANERGKSAKKLPWDKRVQLIQQEFPTALSLDWKAAFDKDLDLFAWILRDILKADGATPGRSGPKPGIDVSTGHVRLRQLMGEDFSILPFPAAFQILAADRSLTSLAVKTKLSRSQVRRLLRGEVTPSPYEMECVAKAFNKQAGYFQEYRSGVVLSAIAQRLEEIPEASMKYYRELLSAAA